MDIIGSIKFRIEKLSINDKQKDILSLLYFVWTTIIIIIILNISVAMVIKMAINIFNTSINIIENYGTSNFENINPLKAFFVFLPDIIDLIKIIIPIVVIIIYVKFFENIKFERELIYILITICVTMLLFMSIKTIMFVVMLLLLLIQINSIGSGKYFGTLKK